MRQLPGLDVDFEKMLGAQQVAGRFLQRGLGIPGDGQLLFNALPAFSDLLLLLGVV